MCQINELSYSDLLSKCMLRNNNFIEQYVNLCFEIVSNCAQYDSDAVNCFECKSSYDLSNYVMSCEKVKSFIILVIILSVVCFVLVQVAIFIIVRKLKKNKVRITTEDVKKIEVEVFQKKFNMNGDEQPASNTVEQNINEFINNKGMINPYVGKKWRTGHFPAGSWRLHRGKCDTRVPPLKNINAYPELCIKAAIKSLHELEITPSPSNIELQKVVRDLEVEIDFQKKDKEYRFPRSITLSEIVNSAKKTGSKKNKANNARIVKTENTSKFAETQEQKVKNNPFDPQNSESQFIENLDYLTKKNETTLDNSSMFLMIDNNSSTTKNPNDVVVQKVMRKNYDIDPEVKLVKKPKANYKKGFR